MLSTLPEKSDGTSPTPLCVYRAAVQEPTTTRQGFEARISSLCDEFDPFRMHMSSTSTASTGVRRTTHPAQRLQPRRLRLAVSHLRFGLRVKHLSSRSDTLQPPPPLPAAYRGCCNAYPSAHKSKSRWSWGGEQRNGLFRTRSPDRTSCHGLPGSLVYGHMDEKNYVSRYSRRHLVACATACSWCTLY